MKRSSHHKKKKEKVNNSSWKITYNRFIPAEEGLREAICTLGNGYFATRGAAPESFASRVHYPATYIAGVYNKLATSLAGRLIFNEDMVNCPNWLYFIVGTEKGGWLIPTKENILTFHQELDMKEGLLKRIIRLKDRRGKIIRIEMERIVHLLDPHRAADKFLITPENYEGLIFLKTALDGRVENKGVARYRQLNSKHLKISSCGNFGKGGLFLSAKTTQSLISIWLASRTHLYRRGKELKPITRKVVNEPKSISQEFKIKAFEGETVQAERTAALYTSNDKNSNNSLSAAIRSVKSSHRFVRLHYR